ncbi:TPR repeat-containing protein [Tolypothrix sp. NIES-4075]|uniref:tetratricopeptide repeat protein n=1 Tax=Tolypothrix sp. NIES-4075 TaxID=2005459 RepID=UPI000B6AB9CB|nr:TPR repeat-containing protein [Tolypothrix sp. NIES-4075]
MNSKYALAYNAIGQVFASQQQWSEAIVEYQKALKINPEYGDALANLALALWEQGKHQDARTSLEKALNIFKVQQRSDKVQQIENILRQLNSGDLIGRGAGSTLAGEKDTEIPLHSWFQAPKFIYAQKQKYLFRDA